MLNNEWEKVNDNTKRLKVFRGWIIKVEEIVYKNNGYNIDDGIERRDISTTFISDPKHEWKISKK